MENNIVVTQDMIDTFTTEMQEAYKKYGDDEGNFHGHLGCEYEQDPWSGLSYDLHHEGWGKCILCTDGDNQSMGGALFDTAEDAIKAWNKRYKED